MSRGLLALGVVALALTVASSARPKAKQETHRVTMPTSTVVVRR